MARRDAWTEAPGNPEQPCIPDPPGGPGTGPAQAKAATALPAVVIGRLLGMEACGTPLVCHEHDGRPGGVLRARSIVALGEAEIGAQVALAFADGDPRRPLVMGVLREDGAPALAGAIGAVDLSADGQRLLVTARDRLVLRCGEASITLTRAGKVLICGTYVLSQSSGANRLKGGSIQLN